MHRSRAALTACTLLAALFLCSLCNAADFGSPSKSLTAAAEQPGSTWLLPELGGDVLHLLGRPAFYGLATGLALAPRALRHEDPELNESWASAEGTPDKVFEYGDKMGSAVWPLAAAGITYSIGKLTHVEGATSFGSDLFRAQTLNGVATLTYKVAVGRTRPNGAAYSFPSGHTSVMFTTAGVIYAHYGPYWGAAAGVVAAYVGLSRLQENRHYLSDVIGGALLGSYIGYTIGSRHREKPVSVSPMIGGGTLGASLSMRF
jgi:membrane-associated phospholipid phosphatase